MTLNGVMALFCVAELGSFRGPFHYLKVFEDTPILSGSEMWLKEFSFY